MNSPTLDPRTKEQLMALLARRIGEYTPDWRYEPGGGDAGAAIVELFGEMFYQTIDKFNQLPMKYYVEFLNLLGVSSPTVTPAQGFVQFHAGGTSDAPIPVPKGTEVFVKPEGGGENIIYETERSIEATTAALTDVYYADTIGGCIEKADIDSEMVFFDSSGGENLMNHRFILSQNDVLRLHGPCEIEVTLSQNSAFLERNTVKRLADPEAASWKYWNGLEYQEFSGVTANENTLTLEKNSSDGLEPDDSGRICIYCDIIKGGEGEITLNGVYLSSKIPSGILSDSIANNDIPISQTAGGYCFGRRPAAYELFYIRSDDIFIKRGARVNVNLDISTVVYCDVDLEPQYEFNRRLIDKSSAVKQTTDDVFVEQVVWEYYNGSGWAALPVWGNTNPFSGIADRDLQIIFDVPGDISQTFVNAESGYYIRARVINVENYLSALPNWILPFVKEVKCHYQYAETKPADYICAYNNGKKTELKNAAGITDLAFTVFAPMPPHPRAMYLRFNRSIHGMPLSILFQVLGEAALGSKISWEVWIQGRFLQVQTVDATQNLRYTGAMYLYITEPLTEAEFFGQSGYWLRMSLSSTLTESIRAVRVSGINLNTVTAIQRQKAVEQFFNTGPYEAGKVITLLEKPVLGCELWVDEVNSISAVEIADLEAEAPDRIRVEREENELLHCWVRWDAIPAIGQAGRDERVYELDSYAGEISFGKGPNGKVPPRGDLNIRVAYSYGGGVTGNRETGEVSALIGSIPRINKVANITPMRGGTDRAPMSKIERLGNKRLRHRFVAMSVADFEEITLEKFERAALVKCFPGTDGNGNKAPGHVCLVIMGRDMDGEHMTSALCREVYAYLSQRTDCNLVAGGRLHVVPSTEMTISIETRVMLHDLDLAAVTQQNIVKGISELIDKVWRARDIGDQIDLGEIYQIVKAVPNVSSITQVLPEGRYRSGGTEHLTALDNESSFPFATVRNGTHIVRIG